MNEKNKEVVSSTIESLYKSTIGQLPIVGPVLNELAFDYSSRIKQGRLNTFIEKLKVYFESVNEVNTENILTEDFHDLFEAILKKVSMTKSEAKLERFKNIIIGQLKNLSEFESVERFVEITGRLSEKQMEILVSYYSNTRFRNECDKKISVLKSQLIKAEIQLVELNKLLQKEKDKKIGIIYNELEMTKINARIDELNSLIQIEFKLKNDNINLIDELSDKMNEAFGGKNHDAMGLSESEHNYLLNDLSSLFLLEKKFSNHKSIGTTSYFVLTDFGKKYIEFVEVV